VIPLRDLNPTRRFPLVTYTLIAANVGIFVYEVSQGTKAQHLINTYGVIPFELMNVFALSEWITPVTSMFLHGGWAHIIGNMWFLHVFGDNVEDVFGKRRFLMFYVVCGVAAAAAQVAMDPGSKIPMVGASGAIAGVLAAYMLLFPGAKIVTLVPIFIFLHFTQIRAWVFLLFWIVLQLLMSYNAMGSIGKSAGGIAFFAHVGGFAAGFAMLPFLKRKRR